MQGRACERPHGLSFSYLVACVQYRNMYTFHPIFLAATVASSHCVLLHGCVRARLHTLRAFSDSISQAGVPYAFWSAHSMIEEQSRLRSEAAALGLEPAVLKRVEAAKASASGVVVDQRIAILDSDQLLELLEFKAHLAVQVSFEVTRHANRRHTLVAKTEQQSPPMRSVAHTWDSGSVNRLVAEVR